MNQEGEYQMQDMTLRDYFAAKVLQSLIEPSYLGLSAQTITGIVENAYVFAQAMVDAKNE